jgi:hypothetical protein
VSKRPVRPRAGASTSIDPRRVSGSARPPRFGAGRSKVPVARTAAELQSMWLPPARGKDPRVRLDGPVSIQSGVARRKSLLRNAADGLPGFRWDVPLPDPQRTLLWASLSFDWQFYEWKSLNLLNRTSRKIFVEGSLDWRWLLTGHPQVFPVAPIFLSGAGHFTFNTFISPGADGFDVGWLAPAASATFSSEVDKTDASMTSPLQRLLAMADGGVLKLWFAMDFQNLRYKLDNGNDLTHGYTLDGGPETLYYAYAYASPFAGAGTRPPLVRG